MIGEAGSAPVLGNRQPGGEGINVETLALRHLAVHISTCPNVDICLSDDRLEHPCSVVVRQNNPSRYSPRALPEPWYGHLGSARILFVSSNPGGGHAKSEPDSDDPKDILQRAEDAFEGLTLKDFGRYWLRIQNLAEELLGTSGGPVQPGVDYAITEVVHCGSAGEAEGNVGRAVLECGPRYTPLLLRLSPATVIVAVGSIARDWFSNHLRLAPPLGLRQVGGPMEIEGRSRLLLSVANPSARSTAPKGFDLAQITAAREHLAQTPSASPPTQRPNSTCRREGPA